jgi:hypothetical protein
MTAGRGHSPSLSALAGWPSPITGARGAADTVVNAGDTAPANDQWNLVAIELLSDD